MISVALMFADNRGTELYQYRSLLSTVIAPLQFLVDKPMALIEWIETNVSKQQALIEENARLRAERLLLRAQVQQFTSLQSENSQLRALLKSSPRDVERVVVAKVLAVAADPYTQELVLASGSRAGVRTGQAVLDANGVIGQVVQVSPYTSRVLLLTDTRSAIPIENSRNNLRGIIMGTGVSDTLSLIHISQTADVEMGDLLVTSGLGERYPAGYPVGVVKTVHHSAGEHFATIVVMPSAHLNRSRLVLLVSRHGQQNV